MAAPITTSVSRLISPSGSPHVVLGSVASSSLRLTTPHRTALAASCVDSAPVARASGSS
jgi:hypothetical protein